MKMNLNCPSPLSDVPFAQTPLLMGHGKLDSFVPLHQAMDLFEQYGFSDKQLYVFNVKHNTSRPNQWFETVARFIYKKLGLEIEVRKYELIFRESQLHVGEKTLVLAEIEADASKTNANSSISTDATAISTSNKN